MDKRFKVSFFVFFIWLAIYSAYHIFQGASESKIAVSQLEDSILSYSVAKFFAQGNFLIIIALIFWFAIVVIWWPRKQKEQG